MRQVPWVPWGPGEAPSLTGALIRYVHLPKESLSGVKPGEWKKGGNEEPASFWTIFLLFAECSRSCCVLPRFRGTNSGTSRSQTRDGMIYVGLVVSIEPRCQERPWWVVAARPNWRALAPSRKMVPVHCSSQCDLVEVYSFCSQIFVGFGFFSSMFIFETLSV